MRPTDAVAEIAPTINAIFSEQRDQHAPSRVLPFDKGRPQDVIEWERTATVPAGHPAGMLHNLEAGDISRASVWELGNPASRTSRFLSELSFVDDRPTQDEHPRSARSHS